MSDRGHAAVEFGLATGLLLIPAALAVLSFGPWSEARVLTEAAAAEAARAAVISLDLAPGEAIAAEMTANHGYRPLDVRLGWCGAAPAPIGAANGACPMGRGTEVTVEVLVYTPMFSTPWGAVGGVWVTGAHAEPVDLYRSIP
jgi:hypothetical protein